MRQRPTPERAGAGHDRRVDGPLLFARYAYGPNRLGLCGPDDAAGLFGQGTQGGDQRLHTVEAGFGVPGSNLG